MRTLMVTWNRCFFETKTNITWQKSRSNHLLQQGSWTRSLQYPGRPSAQEREDQLPKTVGYRSKGTAQSKSKIQDLEDLPDRHSENFSPGGSRRDFSRQRISPIFFASSRTTKALFRPIEPDVWPIFALAKPCSARRRAERAKRRPHARLYTYFVGGVLVFWCRYYVNFGRFFAL